MNTNTIHTSATIVIPFNGYSEFLHQDGPNHGGGEEPNH